MEIATEKEILSSVFIWTGTYIHELQIKVNKIILWIIQLTSTYLKDKDFTDWKFVALTSVFAATLVLVLLTCCLKAKKRNGNSSLEKSANAERTNPIKFNWNVFDLAKSAYEPGHTEAVIQLVEKYKYDVNFVMASSGLSLFLCACLSGEKRLIKYFIDKGADVHVQTREGDSPLYLATFGILNSPNIDTEVLAELVRAGIVYGEDFIRCGVNTQNCKGYTPLHRAAAKGNREVIRCLLKLGADIYIPTKAGIYPMDSAINAGHLDAAEMLKIKVDNPHVWDVVDPHTPPRIQLGLQSPGRKHLIESSRHRPFQKMFTF